MNIFYKIYARTFQKIIIMFTHSCLIRTNSEELRDKLYALGYNICTCALSSESDGLYTYNGVVHDLSIGAPPNCIDCFEQEALFLAIAAIRDDSDADQYYTDGILWEKSIHNEPSEYMKRNGWKATPKELLKYMVGIV